MKCQGLHVLAGPGSILLYFDPLVAPVWCQTPLATSPEYQDQSQRSFHAEASLPPRPHLSKLQTVQHQAMEQTSHYAIITSTTLNTLSTLIIGLHLECQVLFFKPFPLVIKIEVQVGMDSSISLNAPHQFSSDIFLSSWLRL